MFRVVRIITLLALSAVVAACTTPSMEDQPSSEFGAANLYSVNNSGFEQAFVSRDAQLSSYRDIQIESMKVMTDIQMPTTAMSGNMRGDLMMTPEREANLRELWATAMDRAFSAYDRSGAGKQVLRIEAQLTGVAHGLRTTTTIGGRLQPNADALDISADFRLYNAASGQLLAVIRDTRSITAGALSRTAPISMTELFNSWAALLHTRVSGK